MQHEMNKFNQVSSKTGLIFYLPQQSSPKQSHKNKTSFTLGLVANVKDNDPHTHMSTVYL